MSAIAYRYCADCGKKLSDTEIKCPSCGNTKINAQVFITEVGTDSQLKGKIRNNTKTITKEFLVREKISGETKNPAREELVIDKVSKRKLHRVQEKGKDGNWVTVHDENLPLKKSEK